jgi:cyanophycin synthetase
MSVLAIERLEVTAEAVVATVRVVDSALARTRAVPGLATRLSELLPDIVRHRCDCGSSHGVLAELADTETPHLLEHIALEMMALAGSPRTLRGATSWDFARDGRGVFEVRLAYDDADVALAALSEGSAIVDGLFGEAAVPDVDSAVERLKAARPVQPGLGEGLHSLR